MADAQPISLADGGVVTVVLARGANMPAEYTHHPLVNIVEADNDPADVGKCFPSNSRALITTGRLPQKFYERLSDEIQRRKAVALYRPTEGGLEHELDKIVKTSALVATGGGKQAERTIAEKGSVKRFVEEHDTDTTLSITEAGKRIFRLAGPRGVKTTLGSVIQGVSLRRRRLQSGARPASATPRDVTEQVGGVLLIEETIAALEAAVKGLEGLKKWALGIDKELADARRNMETVRALAQLAGELKS